jgi:hypothetical protein
MKNNTAYYFNATLSGLRRKPVMTAMMVCSLVFGVTAAIAGIKVWRASSVCTIAQGSALPSVVQADTDVAGQSDLPSQHQVLQTALSMGGRTPHGGSPLSHKNASANCPCAAPMTWHWQRI